MELAVAFVGNVSGLLGEIEAGGLAFSQVSETNRTLLEGAMISSAVVPSTMTSSDHMAG